MQDDRTKNFGNGNGNSNDGNGALPDMTVKEAVGILLQEIDDVNIGIRQDLGGRVDRLEKKLDKLDGKVDGLRLEVHQNQTTFITNFDHLEKRVEVLEGKAV